MRHTTMRMPPSLEHLLLRLRLFAASASVISPLARVAATSTITTTPTQDCAHAQAGNCPQWNGQAKREGGWSKAEHRAHDGSSTAADPAVGRTSGSGGTCRRTFLLQENSRKVAEGRDTAARGTLEGSHAGLLLSGPTPWFGHRWICPL
eukprot:CAMPEP_0177229742 /NCGR_PEP_ID=MMETSP0367-20130122/41851_1 /TAXON_ID=447022 ORGANISM="Scrippsiella hangoei-like, Strain SHHI-4" /NCGR_SAMPLE_ID=MMETSP0367 /ASSEMBLY_ACC=CAM_ASM_000362 /LENGTH=148 /DNA_ID=CAMNT_0018680141 /DNA_START=206 /DNA_END=653 /DNA_ORIENTATION=-